MPQIQLKQPGTQVADFAVAGNLITVAGLTIDCAARQQDTAVTIEVRSHLDEVIEGGREGAYLAHIHIPARTFTEVASLVEDDASEDGDMGGGVALAPDPLDHNAVVVTLWPVV